MYNYDIPINMDKLPLRERKKIQTRDRILQAAEQLAKDKAYNTITLAEICDKADIAQRTFFAYFPSKEAAFFYDKQLLVDEMSQKFLSRTDQTTTFQILRELLVSKIDSYMESRDSKITKMHHTPDCPGSQLQMYGDYLSQQCEDILRTSIARDLHQSPDSLGPKLAAASTNSALATIMGQFLDDQSKSITKAEILEILDKTLSFLEAGITALDHQKKL
jgi:AcrR family transcriptional regulator